MPVKFSQFVNAGILKDGDITVGLRDGVNVKFDDPGDGIKDEFGNYILKYESTLTTGPNASQYLVFKSTEGEPEIDGAILASDGSNASVSITIRPKGYGAVFLGSSNSDLPQALFLNDTDGIDSFSTDTSLTGPWNPHTTLTTQYAVKTYVDTVASGLVDSVSGTTDRITISGTAANPIVDIASTYVGQTSITTLGTIATGTWNATTIGISKGGTGVTSVTTAPTASSFAGWDANSNLSADNFLEGYQAISTAAGTTTLTVSSVFCTRFTGSTTQNCDLPVVSTLVLGQSYEVINDSSGIVTVRSSGGNTVQAMAANTKALFKCIAITGTDATSWDVAYSYQSGGSVTSVGLTINSTSPSGIFTVTGSPVTTSGSLNINLSGTSGGIPYFSSSTTLSSLSPYISSLYASDNSGITISTPYATVDQIPYDGLTLVNNGVQNYYKLPEVVTGNLGVFYSTTFTYSGVLHCVVTCVGNAQNGFYTYKTLDGKTWTQVGSKTSFSGATNDDCYKCVVYEDGGTTYGSFNVFALGRVQTYSFNGSSWSFIGNSSVIVNPIGISTIVLSSTRYIASVSFGSNGFYIYSVSSGVLTQIGLITASGTTPYGVTTFQPQGLSGAFYISVTNGGSNNFTTYSFDGATVSAIGSAVASGTTPRALHSFVDAGTDFLVVANIDSGNFKTYSLTVGVGWTLVNTMTTGVFPQVSYFQTYQVSGTTYLAATILSDSPPLSIYAGPPASWAYQSNYSINSQYEGSATSCAYHTIGGQPALLIAFTSSGTVANYRLLSSALKVNYAPKVSVVVANTGGAYPLVVIPSTTPVDTITPYTPTYNLGLAYDINNARLLTPGAQLSGLTASQAVVTDASKNLASLAYASANTASALVQRDGSGNFSAGTITATLSGNATSATNIAGGTANDIPYQTGSGSTSFITETANGVLVYNGSGVPSSSTTLPTGLAMQTPASIVLTNGTSLPIVGGTTGTLTETRGGTNQTTYTLGDTLYASASNTLSKLSGNTTTTKQYLSQTGDGVASAAPAWATISGSDITGAALTASNDTNVTLTLGGTPTTALLRAASITAGWTGTLAVGRGGTGTGTTFTLGSVIFAGASGVYTQDNANLFWDDTNNRLGIGNATPKSILHVLAAGTSGLDASVVGTRGISLTGNTTGNCRIYFENTGSTSGQRVFNLDNGNTAGVLAFSSLNDAATSFVTNNILTLSYNGNVGLGTGAATSSLYLTRASAVTSGSAPYLTIAPTADTGLTASTEVPLLNTVAATRTWATGTLTLQRSIALAQSTIAFAGASSITNAAIIGIDGPPIMGTNATGSAVAGLYIASGSSVVNSTFAYGIICFAPTGASINAAAQFLGDVAIGAAANQTPLTRLALSGNSNETTQYLASRTISVKNNLAAASVLANTVIGSLGFSNASSVFAAGISAHYTNAADGTATYLAFTTNATNNQMRLDASGNLGVGTSTNTISARIMSLATTEQLRLAYDTSNYLSVTVGSTGGVTFDATGSGAAFTFADICSITGRSNATSPSTGYVGEKLTASVASGSAVSLTTATVTDITSVAYTAGNWLVIANPTYIGTGITNTELQSFVGTASGTSTTGQATDNTSYATPFAVGITGNATASISFYFSTSSSGTLYLKAKATFTVGTCTAFGAITMIRQP